MSLRLWERYTKIVEEGTSPAYFTSIYFTSPLKNQRLFDLPRGPTDVQILYWDDERRYNGIRFLYSQRMDIGRLQLKFEADRRLFYEYRCALMDSLAVSAFYGQYGPLKRFVTFHVGWYYLSDTVDTAVDKTMSDNQHADVQASVRKMQEAKLAQSIKTVGLVKKDVDQHKDREKPLTVRVRERLELLAEKGVDQTEFTLIGEYTCLKERFELLQSSMLEEDDKAYFEEVRNDMLATEAALMKYRSEHVERDNNKALDELQTYFRNLADEDKATSEATDIFYPSMLWFKDHALLSHGLWTWQFQTRLGIDISCETRMEVKRRIHRDVLSCIKRTSNADMMKLAATYIIERRVQLHERESYRRTVSSRNKFKGMDAWKVDRRDLDMDIENILPGFPATLDGLLESGPDNHYYYEGWDYASRWWIIQHYTGLDPDVVFYYNDIENELNSLSRPMLVSPVMVRLGTNCAIKLTGPWLDETSTSINVTWCGLDPVDCLVEYIRMCSLCDWKIHDRYTGMMRNFANTKIEHVVEGVTLSEMKI